MKKKKHFTCWDCPDYPSCSAACILLLWIAITCVKSGYIFPSLSQLRQKDSLNGNFTSHYEYNKFLNDLKYLFHHLLFITKKYGSLIGMFYILLNTFFSFLFIYYFYSQLSSPFIHFYFFFFTHTFLPNLFHLLSFSQKELIPCVRHISHSVLFLGI